MKAERLKEIPLTDAELDFVRRHEATVCCCEKAANHVSPAQHEAWGELGRINETRWLATIDAKNAEIERLSSQAPLQVSVDAALRIRAEAIVASPYWGGCEKNIAEHILTGKYDSLHASVHKAALATPRGENR